MNTCSLTFLLTVNSSGVWSELVSCTPPPPPPPPPHTHCGSSLSDSCCCRFNCSAPSSMFFFSQRACSTLFLVCRNSPTPMLERILVWWQLWTMETAIWRLLWAHFRRRAARYEHIHVFVCILYGGGRTQRPCCLTLSLSRAFLLCVCVCVFLFAAGFGRQHWIWAGVSPTGLCHCRVHSGGLPEEDQNRCSI